MDILPLDRLRIILDKQQEKLAEMQAAGESGERIDNMKFAIRCTQRRLERAMIKMDDKQTSVRL